MEKQLCVISTSLCFNHLANMKNNKNETSDNLQHNIRIFKKKKQVACYNGQVIPFVKLHPPTLLIPCLCDISSKGPLHGNRGIKVCKQIHKSTVYLAINNIGNIANCLMV